MEISTQVTPGILNYVQSEVLSWVTTSGNLIFQIDKSVPFFSFSCRKIMFVTRILIRNCHQRAAKEIERASNILVMAGAGLSTPSGIPDFRTPG